MPLFCSIGGGAGTEADPEVRCPSSQPEVALAKLSMAGDARADRVNFKDPLLAREQAHAIATVRNAEQEDADAPTGLTIFFYLCFCFD